MAKGGRRKSWVFDGVEWEAAGTTTSDQRRMMMSAMSGVMAGAQRTAIQHTSSAGGGRWRRRPDKKPFVLGIPSSLFHVSRSLPEFCLRYDMVIGEVFWKLAAYIDSVPANPTDRITGKPPHILVTGVKGSGKSYLLAAAAAMLGYAETVLDRRNLSGCISVNGDGYKCVLLSDCRVWLNHPDPLQYFRMEMLASLSSEAVTCGHKDAHPGCMLCVEAWTTLDQAKKYIDRVCRWFRDYRPDTWLLVFVDQAEELRGRLDSAPARILQMLIDAKLPVLIYGSDTVGSGEFPFPHGASLNVPFRMSQAEFNKQMDVLTPPEDRLWGREASLWKDVRLWTGGNPGETTRLMNDRASASFLTRITQYSNKTRERILSLVSSKKFEARHRNTFLIALFAMILRVPLDWSDKFNVKELRDLDPELSALLQTDCLQSFFHPSDGTIAIRNIPTAIGMAHHLALMSPACLSAVNKSWSSLFETVVTAMLSSKQLCAEAKRRFARFYFHAKILWRQPAALELVGKGHLGEDFTIKFRRPRIVVFAGQVPSQYHFLPSSNTQNNQNNSATGPTALLTPDSAVDPIQPEIKSNEPYDSIIFLPGRTSYLFFDAFIYIPDERRLYAICTAPVVTTWLKELEIRAGPSQLQQHRDDGLLTPLILLESWRETLRKAGFPPKLTIKCCLIKPNDLMAAVGCSDKVCPPSGASSKDSAAVDGLASQFAKATNLDDTPDEL